MRTLRTTVSVAGVLAVLAGLFTGTVTVLNVVIALAWGQQQFGYHNGAGNSPHYLFYSGFGSIILPPALTVTGIAALWWWRSQCHISGCLWPARRHTAAGEPACWLHWPKITGHDRTRTVAAMREAHHLYLGKRPGKG